MFHPWINSSNIRPLFKGWNFLRGTILAWYFCFPLPWETPYLFPAFVTHPPLWMEKQVINFLWHLNNFFFPDLGGLVSFRCTMGVWDLPITSWAIFTRENQYKYTHHLFFLMKNVAEQSYKRTRNLASANVSKGRKPAKRLKQGNLSTTICFQCVQYSGVECIETSPCYYTISFSSSSPGTNMFSFDVCCIEFYLGPGH